MFTDNMNKMLTNTMQASKCPCTGCSGIGGYVSPAKQSQSKYLMKTCIVKHLALNIVNELAFQKDLETFHAIHVMWNGTLMKTTESKMTPSVQLVIEKERRVRNLQKICSFI